MCKEINREKEKFFHSITATHFPSAANKFKHKHAVDAFIYFSLIYLKKKLGIIMKVFGSCKFVVLGRKVGAS